MPNLLHSCSDAYQTYRKWVSSNPQTIGDLETTLKWASYFAAGRMSNSPVVTELTYSLANLLVLFNDQIIVQSVRQQQLQQQQRRSNSSSRHHHETTSTTTSKQRLKLLLTTLEYCEVFIEMSARQLWGDRGRWFFVFVVQVCKCAFRLVLTLYHRETIVQTPAVKVLNRKEVAAGRAAHAADDDVDDDVDDDDDDDECSNGAAAGAAAAGAAPAAFGANVNAAFELRRSGRIVRSVEGAPPVHLRTWKGPERRLTAAERRRARQGHRMTWAECVHVFKPLVHLGGCGAFGLDSWKSYGLPLLMDLYSLHLYNRQSGRLSAQQRLELSRRNVQLLMYLVRSPFYERFTKDRIAALIAGVGRTVPLTGGLCAALNEYIPHWQSIYFYMWSS